MISFMEENSSEYRADQERDRENWENLIIFKTIPPSFSVCLLARKFNLVWHLKIKNPRSVFVLLKVSCRRQVNTNKNEINSNSCFLRILSKLFILRLYKRYWEPRKYVDGGGGDVVRNVHQDFMLARAEVKTKHLISINQSESYGGLTTRWRLIKSYLTSYTF